MRVKVLKSFIHNGTFLASGKEVDIPKELGVYLLSVNAVKELSDGRGAHVKEVPDTVVAAIPDKVADAVKTLKPRTKPKQEPKTREEPKEENKIENRIENKVENREEDKVENE